MRKIMIFTAALAMFLSPQLGWADDAPIRLATVAIDPGAEPYYAQELGFFKDAGLNVDVETNNQGSAIAAGVVSGSIDIGFANLTSLATAYAHKVPITLIAPAGIYDSKSPTSVCMVPKNSTITSGKDLDGKTFATSTIRSIGELGPRIWIDKTGGDSSTVKFVEIPFSSMSAALAEHRVDAALVSEPQVAAALSVARVLSDCYTAVAPRFLVAAFFTSTAWANAHPDLVAKFANVMERTAIWANANQSKSAIMYARQAKVDPKVVGAMKRSSYGERLDPKEMQPVIDLSAKYGLLGASFPASDMIFREGGH